MRGATVTRWFSADGIVEPDAATRAVLATQRLAARSYSPSALQHFAACPYRFLLHAIHQLRPREEKVALEQMDPLTRGALFHEAQFRLFRELQVGATAADASAKHAARILEIADGVLDRVAAENEEKLAPAIPRVWRSEIEDLRTDLRGWIQHAAAERTRLDAGAFRIQLRHSHADACRAIRTAPAPKPCWIAACACAGPST